MDYIMQAVSGLGKGDRKQLAAIIRGTKGAVSVGEAATILDVSRVAAAKKLARWASKGLQTPNATPHPVLIICLIKPH